MSNYSAGHDAEKIAADYLRSQGYRVLELNWRHRRAEIDIVAEKKTKFGMHKRLIFFEVKYRKTSAQGNGLDYITPKKLKQMQFAAELYVAEHDYNGEYALGAIEMSGLGFEVTNCIDNICQA